MSLLLQYLTRSQSKQALNSSDFNDPIEKVLSPSEADSEKKITDAILPTQRSDMLNFLAKYVPSASQCITKIISSVLSDGIEIVPTANGKKSKKQRAILLQKIIDWDMENVVARYLRDYLTYGDGYLYPVPNQDESDIVEVQVPDPSKMTIRVDKELLEETGIYVPRIYQFRVKSGRGASNSSEDNIYFQANELIRWERPGVSERAYGLAPLEEDTATTMFGIRVLNHNLRFFQNNGKPSLIFNLAEGTTREKAIAFKRFVDEHYKGPNKAWESMVSYGGMKVQELQLPDQTSFFDFLTYARIQVCGLFEVPPFEVGVVDKSGLNNVETQHKDFIKTNINEKKKKLASILNRYLLPRMGITDWELYFPPMDAVNEKQRIELNALALSSSQITLNEARKRNNLSALEADYADDILIGDPKGLKGFSLLSKTILLTPELGAGTEPDSGNNSGRGDLDGRDREPDQSMNK